MLGIKGWRKTGSRRKALFRVLVAVEPESLELE